MPAIEGGKFVVVGGASLVGSHIAEQLLAGGAREMVLIDNLSLGSTGNIQHLLGNSRCSFVKGDMLRLNELYDPFEGADGVFSVAGFLGRIMAADPWTGIEVNVRGLQNVLEASRYQSVKKVIFSSSVGVYGVVGAELNTDDSPLRWQGMAPGRVLYCASKVMGEGLGRLYHERHGLGFLALRYSAVYGERQHKRSVDGTRMVDFYEHVRAGKRPVIDGDGQDVQDYIYVGDLARANLLAMQSNASGEGMGIVSGIDTSQNRVAELIAQACGSALTPEYRRDGKAVWAPLSHKQGYSRERARKLIGWEPEVDIGEGLRRVIGWLDQERALRPAA